MRFPSFRSVVALATGTAFLLACTIEATPKKRKRAPAEPGDEFWDEEVYDEQPLTPAAIDPDSGAFGAPNRPKEAGAVVDAGPGVGPKVLCATPLAAGSLAIVELLISSRAGGNDEGEWVEIRNIRSDCWVNLQGITIESPRGALPANSVTVTEALEIGPGQSFVVADSADPAKNNGLPGIVVSWDAADVLKNDGDTVRVLAGTTVLDEVTYPNFNNLEASRTVAFPTDCAMSFHKDWTRWSLTFNEWRAGKKGTPNGSNDDVACF